MVTGAGRPDRIGFIGLGRMGAAMAANLARAGLPLTVHNRTRAIADAFVAEQGGTVAAGATALAAASDVIITMLADDAALREVMTGPTGVLAGLVPGSLVIDMGTVGRAAILDLAPLVAARGGTLIDAPVSGVPAVAAEGRLTIMAAGPDAAIDRAMPILERLGSRIIRVGPLGAGAAMKLAINTAIHGYNQAVSEALVLAERAGVDRATAYEVFVSGAISGPFVVNRRRVFEQPGEGPQPFSMHLAAKDVRLALALAETVGAPVPQARLNLSVMEEAIAAGLGDLDESAVSVHLRRTADAAAAAR